MSKTSKNKLKEELNELAPEEANISALTSNEAEDMVKEDTEVKGDNINENIAIEEIVKEDVEAKDDNIKESIEVEEVVKNEDEAKEDEAKEDEKEDNPEDIVGNTGIPDDVIKKILNYNLVEGRIYDDVIIVNKAGFCKLAVAVVSGNTDHLVGVAGRNFVTGIIGARKPSRFESRWEWIKRTFEETNQ